MNEKHSEEMEILLDRAVEHYRAAEPRTGLEQRILAGLRSAPAPAFDWHWRGVAVTAVATLTAAGALYWALRSPSVSPSPEQPAIARTAPAETPAAPVFSQPAATAPRPVAEKTLREGPPEKVMKVMVAAADTLPRRATFPSPRELSPQEKLLLRYMQAAPRELVASPAQPSQPPALGIMAIAKITIKPLPGFIALKTEEENTQGE